jgi:hypothetical protein
MYARRSDRNAKSERQAANSTLNRSEFALLLNQFRDETGPAGLMRRTQSGANVAVKIFVK